MLSVGIKMHCLERQSTTTRIVVCPEEAGSCLMKSIEMEFHGFKGIGSCFRSPYGLCLGTFAHAQVVHEEMYSLMKVHTPGQVYSWHMSSKVWFCLKCLEKGVIVLVVKNTKTEVIRVRDIDMVIKMEVTIRVD